MKQVIQNLLPEKKIKRDIFEQNGNILEKEESTIKHQKQQ